MSGIGRGAHRTTPDQLTARSSLSARARTLLPSAAAGWHSIVQEYCRACEALLRCRFCLLFRPACSLLRASGSGAVEHRDRGVNDMLNHLRLGHAGLLTATLATILVAAPAAAQTKIKFSLDFKFEGPAAPFLVAIDKGYFQAEGLDVTIDTAAGSLEPINRVASGTYDMGFGDINSLIKFRDANPTNPIKAVFMVYNKPAFSVVGRKSRGVNQPKDLE